MRYADFIPTLNKAIKKWGLVRASVLARILANSSKYGYSTASKIEIAESLNLSRTCTSKHIEYLEDNGYLYDRDKGKRNSSHRIYPTGKTLREFEIKDYNFNVNEVYLIDDVYVHEDYLSDHQMDINVNEDYLSDNQVYMNKCIKKEFNKNDEERKDTMSLETPEGKWNAIKNHLQLEMDKAAFDTWIKHIEFISCENDLLTLGVINDSAKEWLESRLTSTISRKMSGLMGKETDVQFVVQENNE